LTAWEVRGQLDRALDPLTTDRERLVSLLAAVEQPARAAALPSDDALIEVARRHRLSALLSATSGATLPDVLAVPFRRDRLVTTARNLAFAHLAEECLRALAAARIDVLVLKGIAYESLLYRAVGVRPTADIDLLVRADDRRRAFAVLDRIGFEPRAAAPGFDDPDYHEVAWTRRDGEVDLHLALAPPARCRIDYDAVWRDAQPVTVGSREALTLSLPHTALFHTLHMAIDHFHVPAIYLVDLARLLPRLDFTALVQTARAWHCYRPLATALALTATFLPASETNTPLVAVSAIAERVIARYGAGPSLPRSEQLVRKLAHFDSALDAVRYTVLQSRRKLREQFERRVRRRSARERLAL
jgi:hypothetical protein